MHTDGPDELASPSINPQRIEDLWFSDGTLVLATDASLFRIYGVLLARESRVFHDMLQLPQPPKSETVDGCPVVRLLDESVDVEYFLKALFDYKFFPPPPDHTTLAVIRGVLRLSKKYEVEALYKRALAHLESGFPLTPEDFPCSGSSWDFKKNGIATLLLARELSLDWLLPISFYRVCAETPISEIHAHTELDPQDKLTCLEQCLALQGPPCSEIINFLWDPKDICGSQKCQAQRMEVRKQAEGWRSATVLPLSLWEESDWVDLKGLGVCGICLSGMKRIHKEALDAFWERLPGRFGLRGWDGLNKMKNDMMNLSN